jgi:succinate dehydrogenase / fumarate reductase flavoprotein subunit
MLRIADAMIEGSLLRKESRGSHYRTDFPKRHDGDFLKTSVARLDPSTDRCTIAYEDVEVGLVVPRERNYAKSHAPAKEEATPAAAAS